MWKTEGDQLELFFCSPIFNNLKPSPGFLIPTMIISRIGGRLKKISLNSFSVLRYLTILNPVQGFFNSNYDYLQDKWKTEGDQLELFFYTPAFNNLKLSLGFLIPTMIISRKVEN